MLYEIINPSDQYTIESEDFKVACVATLLLGSGQWGLKQINGDAEMPLFLFGGVDEWFAAQFNQPFAEVVEAISHQQLGEVLDTVLIGGADERQVYNDGLALIDDPLKREEWRNRWHEQRRTSLNDIGARAYSIAESLREG